LFGGQGGSIIEVNAGNGGLGGGGGGAGSGNATCCNGGAGCVVLFWSEGY
jgi:hypothetical protein